MKEIHPFIGFGMEGSISHKNLIGRTKEEKNKQPRDLTEKNYRKRKVSMGTGHYFMQIIHMSIMYNKQKMSSIYQHI